MNICVIVNNEPPLRLMLRTTPCPFPGRFVEPLSVWTKNRDELLTISGILLASTFSAKRLIDFKYTYDSPGLSFPPRPILSFIDSVKLGIVSLIDFFFIMIITLIGHLNSIKIRPGLTICYFISFVNSIYSFAFTSKAQYNVGSLTRKNSKASPLLSFGVKALPLWS